MKTMTYFNKRHSLTEPRTDLYNSKRVKEDACQASELTLIHWNKSWTVRTAVLKWVVTKGRNPIYDGLWILKLYRIKLHGILSCVCLMKGWQPTQQTLNQYTATK
jgi:hypothetical protein